MTDLLRVEDLAISFRLQGGLIDAVRGVSLPRAAQAAPSRWSANPAPARSVIARRSWASCRARARSARGEILFADPADRRNRHRHRARCRATARAMRAIRGGRISIIFQEPMTSLSPLHTIGNQIGEALQLHRQIVPTARGREADRSRCCAWSASPTPSARSTPIRSSCPGGLRQRAMIAMALVCRPALLIADEPTTALDVTIQAQILKLIKRPAGASSAWRVLLITHDLGVVANMADEVVVMYHGQVMESGHARGHLPRPAAPLSQGAAAARCRAST